MTDQRTSYSVVADDSANAIRIADNRDPEYDYVAISQNDDHVIVSREQLPALIRQLWAIQARRSV